MTFEFKPAKRERVPLLVSLAGGTGSGKTLSGLYIARGLAGGAPFAGIDTESRRMLHYADDFPELRHTELDAPFTPSRYVEAIKAAEAEGFGVIFIDSGSHAYAGSGGLLDWHEAELQRMAGEDWKKRDAMTFAAWIKPKMAQKAFVSELLRVRAHIVIALRAEERIEIVKKDGKTVVQPKKSLVGADGWVPVCEKNFAYEMTVSFLLTAANPGTPIPIKVPRQFESFFPLDRPVDEATGRKLGEWAAGGVPASAPTPPPESPADDSIDFGTPANGNGHLEETVQKLTDALIAIGEQRGNREVIEAAIVNNLAKNLKDQEAHATWLASQLERAQSAVPA